MNPSDLKVQRDWDRSPGGNVLSVTFHGVRVASASTRYGRIDATLVLANRSRNHIGTGDELCRWVCQEIERAEVFCRTKGEVAFAALDEAETRFARSKQWSQTRSTQDAAWNRICLRVAKKHGLRHVNLLDSDLTDARCYRNWVPVTDRLNEALRQKPEMTVAAQGNTFK